MQADSSAETPRLENRLSDAQVVAWADLALAGIEREYPNKPSHVVVGPQSLKSPRQLHPAFYGCFDWHSSVHSHWMLVRLLKLYPSCSSATRMRDQLDRHLTQEKMEAEAAYFESPQNRSFERMYGWAWALRLATELHSADDEPSRRWRESIRPLESSIVSLTADYLPRLAHPIRTGVHPDTAFALGQTFDYARVVGNKHLEELVASRARRYFLDDRDYPARFEPAGEDFFSAGLNEADLMRRILDKDNFAAWLGQFLPGLHTNDAGPLLTPIELIDASEGKFVHLAGLNLSRAWTMRGIATALAGSDPRRVLLNEAAALHAQAGYRYVLSGHYEGEHWLATFAVYLQTGVGLPRV